MGDITITDDQLNSLANKIGDRMAEHPPVCRAFDLEEIVWFKSCHHAAQKTKSVALATTVGFLVLGIFTIIGAGILQRIKELIGVNP